MKSFLPGLWFLLLTMPAFSQAYTGTTGPISDDGIPNLFISQVAGLNPAALNAGHGLVRVCLNITHTYDSDLDVKLMSPGGTTITLFSGVGGGGHNFTNTCLCDTVSLPITQGAAPFAGTYRPMDILGNVNDGSSGNGMWTLIITDTYPYADQGTLNAWSLEFGPNATTPLTVDSSNLPLVLINTFGQTIPNEPKITANMKIIDYGPGQMNHPADPPNVYDGYVGIEIRGSSSAWYPQKPYGFETRDSLGNNNSVSLLGMPPENDWILLANYNDKVFMRNTLAYHLFQKMGHYAARARFCEVLLNNTYQGLYVFTEKIKRDQNRIDIHKLDTSDNTGNDLTGGYIIKVDYHEPGNSWMSSFSPIDHPGFQVYYVYDYPDAQTITPQQKTYIQNYFFTLESALYSPDFMNPATGYRACIDVNSLIDYFIVNEVSRNNDGFKKSMFFYKDRDNTSQKLFSGPVWDFDWAFKNVAECSIFAATDGSGWAYKVNDCNPDNNGPGWAVRLLQDPAFAAQLHTRYFGLRTTLLDTAYLFDYIDSVHVLVEQAQARHYQKWPILGINVGTPEVDPQPLTYDGEIAKFKNWIRLRLAWLDANMPGSIVSGMPVLPDTEDFLRVYPNPVRDYLRVETSLKLRSAAFYDPEGRLRLSLPVNGHSPGENSPGLFDLDTSPLPAGLYFMRLETSQGSGPTVKVAVFH